MICPYNLKSETQMQYWQQNPENEQDTTDGANVTRTVYHYMQCLREHCGAWYNGKCCYNKAGD